MRNITLVSGIAALSLAACGQGGDGASADKAAKAQGTQLPSGTGTVTYDLWIDDQDLMRRLEFGNGASGMTMTLERM